MEKRLSERLEEMIVEFNLISLKFGTLGREDSSWMEYARDSAGMIEDRLIELKEMMEVREEDQMRGTSCRQCGKKMNPAEAMLGPVCGECTRKNHKKVANG